MGQDLPYYLPIAKECEVFEHVYKHRLPLLLKGPTGSGKSRFVEYMASKLGLELITVSCHDETSAVDLMGRYLLKGQDTVWIDGPLTRAVREGKIIYLDEIAEARPDTLVVLHSLTDHRRELYLERHNETLKAPDSFMLVASFNPGYQRSFKELKASTRQRFVSLSFSYPQEELETQIVQKESGVNHSSAKSLVQLGTKLRNLVELGLTHSASTRLLVDAAKLIESGLSPRLSCEVAVVQPLSDDPDTVEALKNLVSLFF